MTDSHVFSSPAALASEVDAPIHLAIGMFDGVHRGHCAVLETAVHRARTHGGKCTVLTFKPHPSRLFRPEEPTLLLQPLDIRARLLREHASADYVIEQIFDWDFAAIPAEGFVPFLKAQIPRLASITTGENFRFGNGRKGDGALLKASAKELGIDATTVERLVINDLPVSSTRIRNDVANGALATANQLLGYDYLAEGTVEEGRKLGRSIGFPTLNLPWEPELQPCRGVYAMSALEIDAKGHPRPPGRQVPAVANYGLRPTVEGPESVQPLLELHLLGENLPEWGPGTRLRTYWHRFLRAEERFPSLDALKAQIKEDRHRALAFFME